MFDIGDAYTIVFINADDTCEFGDLHGCNGAATDLVYGDLIALVREAVARQDGAPLGV